MKKCFFFIFIFFSIKTSFAQDKKLNEADYTMKNHFVFSPLHFVVNTLQFGLERDFSNRRNSVLLLGSLLLSKNSNQELKLGFGGEFFFKIKISRNLMLLSPEKHEGFKYPHQYFYVATFVQYNYFSQEHNNQTYTIVQYPVSATYTIEDGNDEIISMGGGLVIGMRFTFAKKFDFDLFTGGGIKYASISATGNISVDEYSDGILEPGFTGVFPKIGFKIGYGF